LFALAGIKQNYAGMFQVPSGQLDNKGLKLTCKAKTTQNRAFCPLFVVNKTWEADETGLRHLKPSHGAVF
jgi:hypothetical protein